MSLDPRCEAFQLELSEDHDEGRAPTGETARHVASCPACHAFAGDLVRLDGLLARGADHLAPDVAGAVVRRIGGARRRRLGVAAAVVVGLAIGGLVGGLGARLTAVEASDLGDRLAAASPAVSALDAELLVVERGWHPDVPERVYTGSLGYIAPESLSITLHDTTRYPSEAWTPNHLRVSFENGDLVAVAVSPCPVAALPGCQAGPVSVAVTDQKPFSEGVLVPLEIVSPARTLRWWSGMDVVGRPRLDGRETIQAESTVAGAAMIRAVTERGAWRELHPSDRVVMWLDADLLVPVRLEVYPAASPERDLWQLRRGYTDGADQPILIVEVDISGEQPAMVTAEPPPTASSAGFEDRPVDGHRPVLDPGFTLHRSGRWVLPEGGVVEAVAYSDGASWLMVESTGSWDRTELFGATIPFMRRIELAPGSTGYVSAEGDAVAIHGAGIDVLVSGSVPLESLVAAAASLGIEGSMVPDDWLHAAVAEPGELPAGALVPEVDGWSLLAAVDGDRVTQLMTGGGSRTVVVTSEPGARLDPPIGADFIAVEVRGTTGRFDSAGATLEWVEGSRVVRMRSETVAVEELVEIAGTMSPP